MTDLTPAQRLRLAELETALTRAQIRAAGMMVKTFEALAKRDAVVNPALSAKAAYLRTLHPALQQGTAGAKIRARRSKVTEQVEEARHDLVAAQ